MCFAFVATPTFAISISPQMIQQFKNLPKSEQQRIAQQYGVNLSDFNIGDSNNASVSNPQVTSPKSNKSVAESSGRMSSVFDEDPTKEQTKSEQTVENQNRREKHSLKRFGYDFFSDAPSTFAAASDVPVPSTYMIGPGDTLKIKLYGKESDSYDLTVQRDGSVTIPQLGPITLVGLNFADAKQTLIDKIKREMIGVDVSITMGELRTIRVFVSGEAYKPGSYTLSSLSTLTQALYVSGGVSDIGSLRDIQVKRAGKIIADFDVYSLLLEGDTSNDVRLESGDVIFIPTVGNLVSISGEVNRPAIFETKDSETIDDVLKMASGLKPGAYPKSSTIERFEASKAKTILSVDLTNLESRQTHLQNGDFIHVKSTTSKIDNAISVFGAVVRPGDYQWHDGITIADLLPSVWDDLTIEADLDYALVVREKNQRGDIKVIQVNLGNAISSPTSIANTVLRPRDKLIVFDYADRKKLLAPVIKKLREQSRFGEPVLTAKINGSVRFPGEYPITRKSTTVRELLIAAGGMKEGAYTLSAELTRTMISDVNGVTIQHRQLDLQRVLDNNSTSNELISSRDTITVRNLPDWQETRWVTIKGEVKFPGTYSIQKGETIEDVLQRAGGYTDDADLYAALFFRRGLREKEAQEIKRFSQQIRREIATKSLSSEGISISYSDANKMLTDLQSIKPVGRLVIDLPAISLGDKTADIQLKDKDELVIPTKRQTISVIGEVQHPTSHRFKGNLTLKQYIEMSGGMGKRADDERVYVIRANGSVSVPDDSMFSDDVALAAGDTIVVPLDTEYKDSLTLWSQITGIIYNSAVALAALGNL